MAAQRTPERTLLDLNQVVDEALLFVRHEIEARSIELSVRLSGDLPHVRGDRVQLQQVVVNLLLNAVQAIVQGNPSGGESVPSAPRATPTEPRPLPFMIAGPALMRIIRRRFSTASSPPREDGIGIGLAICHGEGGFIAAHGGTLAVSNHAMAGRSSISRCRRRKRPDRDRRSLAGAIQPRRKASSIGAELVRI